MRHLLTTAAVMVSAQAAAETVTIRSGEHDTFSRLVLAIPPDANWNIERRQNGYLLAFGDAVTAVDVSSVFDRIPRTRISAATASDRQLTLSLACDCYLDTFLFREDRLVVDIIDGPPPPDSRFEPEITPSIATVELPLLLDRTEPTLLAGLPDPFLIPEPRDTDVTQTERALIDSFAQAGMQGLFSFPELPVDIDVLPGLHPFDEALGTIDFGANSPGLSLRTGLETAVTEPASGIPQCPITGTFDLADWSSGESYADIIPDLQRAITTEAGGSRDEDIIALAQAYVAFGFGAEGRQTLRLLQTSTDLTDFVAVLSFIVDQDPVSAEDLAPFMACTPQIALWHVLATGEISSEDPEQSAAVLTTFRALPDALRGHLGVQLADIFVRSGQTHSAEDILSTATSGLTIAPHTLSRTQGRVGGDVSELSALQDLVMTSPRANPDDLVRLFELASVNAVDLNPIVSELAAGHRFEHGQAETFTRLLVAEVEFHTARQRPDLAWNILASALPSLDDATARRLTSLTLKSLAEYGSTELFLPLAFDPPRSDLSAAAMGAISTRLQTLGFDAPPGGLDTSDTLTAAWQRGDWAELQTSQDALLSVAGAALLEPAQSVTPQTAIADSRAILSSSEATRQLASDLLSRFVVDTE